MQMLTFSLLERKSPNPKVKVENPFPSLMPWNQQHQAQGCPGAVKPGQSWRLWGLGWEKEKGGYELKIKESPEYYVPRLSIGVHVLLWGAGCGRMGAITKVRPSISLSMSWGHSEPLEKYGVVSHGINANQQFR